MTEYSCMRNLQFWIATKSFRHYSPEIENITNEHIFLQVNWQRTGGLWVLQYLSFLSHSLTYTLSWDAGLGTWKTNRRTIDLKTIIKLYNVFQIVSNALLVYYICVAGWYKDYFFACVRYSFYPKEYQVLWKGFI